MKLVSIDALEDVMNSIYNKLKEDHDNELNETITKHNEDIENLSNKIEDLESSGGGSSPSIEIATKEDIDTIINKLT